MVDDDGGSSDGGGEGYYSGGGGNGRRWLAVAAGGRRWWAHNRGEGLSRGTYGAIVIAIVTSVTIAGHYRWDCTASG
ncbi:hypothetical protein L6452_39981 [Arctium lappa]|uniref:Uncharacterized protein n=1 Tax=Arctium lappa TaxID=4217 RepID=A0ACB8XTV0_ARCLA|nr:hypothetical protein L6452_39981 [Arctium lappa]